MEIELFVLIFAHAYKYFRETSVINNNMASRDNLKKVNKRTLQKMCTDIGLDATGKKKEELADLLFTNGIPTQNTTPVIDQHTSHTGVFSIVDMHISYPHSINVHTLLCHIYNFQAQVLSQSTILWLLELVTRVMIEEYKISKGWIGLSDTLKLEMCKTYTFHR